MEKELKDFINDWEINKKESSATHSSGIGFKYIQNGEDSRPRLEILNMPHWFQLEMSTGKSFQECKLLLGELRNQFIAIQKEIISSSQMMFSLNKGDNYER